MAQHSGITKWHNKMARGEVAHSAPSNEQNDSIGMYDQIIFVVFLI
jgi:hypothetical protein